MALSIRSFRVDWLAYVDPAVYRGFRVALTETGRDPQWGAVHWANVRPLLAGNGRYAYEFRNVSLDNSKGYTAWVQVLGDGLESRWEGVANIYAPDDGVGLLLTEAAAELLRATLAQLEGQIDGELAVWFGDGEPLVDGYPAEDWTTPSLLSEHTGDVYYDRLSGSAYRFDGAAWAPLSDASMLAAVARARAALEMSGSRAQVIVTDSPSNLPNPPYNVNDLWLNGTDIMVCVTVAGVGATASLSHWDKRSAYMDTSMSGSEWEDPDNPGQIDGGTISEGTVTGDQVAEGAITGTHIEAGAITADHIEARAITADHLAVGAITADMITTGTLNADVIQQNGIPVDKIASGVVAGAGGGGLGSYTVPTCAQAFVYFSGWLNNPLSQQDDVRVIYNDNVIAQWAWTDGNAPGYVSFFKIVAGGGSLVVSASSGSQAVSCGFFAIK